MPGRERAVDGEHAADAVDDCSRQRRDQREGGEEHPVGHRDPDADVTDLAGLGGERVVLLLGPAEELREQRAGDVEALRHHRAHLGVGLHGLPRESLQRAPDVACRHQEERAASQERST